MKHNNFPNRQRHLPSWAALCGLFVLATPPTLLNAQQLTRDEVMGRALQFFHDTSTSGPRRAGVRGAQSHSESELEMIASSAIVSPDSLALDASTGQPLEAFYVVQPNEGDEGYVIVGADARQYRVLGYSYEGHIDPTQLGDNMLGWLSIYAREMRSLAAASSAAETQSSTPMVLPVRPEGVAPMLTTKWNQYAPFNNQCPNPDNRDEPCVTGCVATAMAQMMKFYNYPVAAKGTVSRWSSVANSYIEQTVGGTPYDWSNMLDSYRGSYTEQQGDAVAQLMHECGIAVGMSYGYRGSGSGASTSSMHNVLYNHFSYDRDIVVLSNNGVDAMWHRLLLNDLHDDHPVMYATLGHCFVVDGYEMQPSSSDVPYYHINMGWGGSDDGYMSLTSLNGLGEVEDNHIEMVLGIKPEDNSMQPYYKVSSVSGIPEFIQQGSEASSATVKFSIASSNSKRDITETVSGKIQLVAYSVTGQIIQLGEWAQSDMTNVSVSDNIDFAKRLPVGANTLEWRLYSGQSQHYTIARSGEECKVIIFNKDSDIRAELLSIPKVFEASNHYIKVRLTNRGTETYYGGIVEQFDSEAGQSSSFVSDNIILRPGESQVVEYHIKMPDIVSCPATFSLKENYQMKTLLDLKGNPVSFGVETQSMIPEIHVSSLTPSPSEYLGNGMSTIDRVDYHMISESDSDYDIVLGLVVTDDEYNILEVLVDKEMTVGRNWQYNGYFLFWGKNLLTYGTRYDGSLANGKYRLTIAARTKNASQWSIFPGMRNRKNVWVTFEVTDKQAIIGDENVGKVVLYRPATLPAASIYHRVSLAQSGRGRLFYGYEQLFQPVSHKVVKEGDPLEIRIDAPDSHRAIVRCGQSDISSQVDGQWLRFDNVQSDLTLQISFEEVSGDANNDAVLDVTDLTSAVRAIHDADALEDISFNGADANHDGKLDAQDAQQIAELIVKGQKPAIFTPEYVDLGLEGYPNLRWATTNLGAEHPYEKGDYFAWGETVTKGYFDKFTYTLYPEGSIYGDFERYSTADQLTSLLPADDAARVQWGEGWRLPQPAEIEALREQCTIVTVSSDDSPYNGVAGFEIIGPNGNKIFLPNNEANDPIGQTREDDCPNLWTSSLAETQKAYVFNIGWYYRFDPEILGLYEVPLPQARDKFYRYIGLPIRPVFEVK